MAAKKTVRKKTKAKLDDLGAAMQRLMMQEKIQDYGLAVMRGLEKRAQNKAGKRYHKYMMQELTKTPEWKRAQKEGAEWMADPKGNRAWWMKRLLRGVAERDGYFLHKDGVKTPLMDDMEPT